MGRSRAVSKIADDDPNQSRSSKRKRIASNAEPAETTPYNAVLGQGNGERKAPLYHCNYCNKDISGKIRIKCVICPDFDLCIECFSVGAEVTPHKSNHPYRVMDNLAFPLICPDWNADEETLLLEGIGMYGFGNWAEVAEHVGTKSKAQCIDHYNSIYMNSPCFPLPDLSHVMGKSKDELLAMAKGPGVDVKIEVPLVGELQPKDESPISARIKYEESRKGPGPQSSTHPTEVGVALVSGSVEMAPNKPQIKDETKVEEPHVDRSIGEKKPRISGDEGPSITELSGYNFKRQEFEIEYDNDAEQLLADMEFKDSDTDAERELKLRVLRIYSKRLDERKRRKDFILERNLLYPDPFEKNLSPEEREIYQGFKVFMRFHSKEEHEALLRNIIEEHHIVKRIQDLKEARAAGCRTADEAKTFIEQKRKEAEETALRIKEGSQAGPSVKVLQKPNHLKGELDGSPRGLVRGATDLNPSNKDSSLAMRSIASSLDDWDITGFAGADLLSETEKRLCREIRILPAHYLNMLQTMSVEVLNGKVTKKADAYNLFNVDRNKVDRVYDMLVKKGIART
ncbi:Transcriptional adapter ADA2 [Morus notabilis]|uniref:Transcriptional adapter n=1 Tax=Morus notabilis TaxID=981085 RepID=W9RN14_9ROSA|nr:transcriptional adapter ADA2a isoform X1 [Morus notabilis]EXB98283.1 Transcriptional adapter ADA2 [Morus notabilis]